MATDSINGPEPRNRHRPIRFLEAWYRPQAAPPSRSWRLAAGLAFAVFVAALPVLAIAEPARAAVTVPAEGVSYYIQTNVPSDLYDLGCAMGSLNPRPGTQHPIVHLEFGGPITVNGTSGPRCTADRTAPSLRSSRR